MIYEVSGDILLSDARAIAHGVAPNDNFASGLALNLREHWPSLYKDFRNYCHIYHPKSGEQWTWVNAEGQRIVNLMTQEAAYDNGAKPGKASTEYVNRTLKALKLLIEEEKIESLALPKLATGVGGLNWDDVRPLIYKHLEDLDIPIYIYTLYQKGVKAEEKA
ncbi:O-acetyl-ADP-ribose deacetylase (regulator of RNase III) [Acinetobacter calcoaceticus]|uniref:O-acetyl-ADP-ribose deacetylase (Regulator of RNase III) n=1 Tax=Acinetobacter calcoaceticus TaxID=471 RepID=A0A4R1Y5N2_ACICA|nr:O-acetyl-ADP-ribose deacetylase (regulator of RNase III) [Acinetobacter calcoaceticus]